MIRRSYVKLEASILPNICTFGEFLFTPQNAIMPTRFDWNQEEMAVALYFDSRNLKHEAILRLLEFKCQRVRTMAGLRNKLNKIRYKDEHLWDRELHVWRPQEVDQWLEKLGVADLTALNSFEEEDQAVVNEVDQDARPFLSCTDNLLQERLVAQLLNDISRLKPGSSSVSGSTAVPLAPG